MLGRDVREKILQALAGRKLSPVQFLLGLEDRLAVSESNSRVACQLGVVLSLHNAFVEKIGLDFTG